MLVISGDINNSFSDQKGHRLVLHADDHCIIVHMQIVCTIICMVSCSHGRQHEV